MLCCIAAYSCDCAMSYVFLTRTFMSFPSAKSPTYSRLYHSSALLSGVGGWNQVVPVRESRQCAEAVQIMRLWKWSEYGEELRLWRNCQRMRLPESLRHHLTTCASLPVPTRAAGDQGPLRDATRVWLKTPQYIHIHTTPKGLAVPQVKADTLCGIS